MAESVMDYLKNGINGNLKNSNELTRIIRESLELNNVATENIKAYKLKRYNIPKTENQLLDYNLNLASNIAGDMYRTDRATTNHDVGIQPINIYNSDSLTITNESKEPEGPGE